jgi:hypothetical protein
MARGPPRKRGRKPNPRKPRTVRVAVPLALYANLQTLADDFGKGRDVADVLRQIATEYVGHLQDENRLPDRPLEPE